jgi:hypothetical protein
MNELRKPTVPFTQIENRILRNPYLTFKAKGLYAYMMSMTDGWRFAMDRITKETKESIDAVRSAFTELEEMHLVSRRKKSDGFMLYQFHAFEESTLYDPPLAENRVSGKFL